MEKLTLKELSAYLPYETIGISRHGTLFILDTSSNMLGKGMEKRDIHAFLNNDIKPILYPLDYFGNRDDLRLIHEFIGLGKWCQAYDDYFDIWFDDLANIDKLVLQAPYEIFQYFLANKFDVFNLINRGLAIPITETFNPYI